MIHNYTLLCPICNTEFYDDGFTLHCRTAHEPALLSTKYANKQFEPDTRVDDITRYRSWLPWMSRRCGAGRTITYRSEQLNNILELSNLWIAFNGYWPEKGAMQATTTFKELEAYAVLSRLPENPSQVLVVASAGNTAAAFAHMCSQNTLPCLIILPERALHKMVFSQPLASCVKIITVTGFSDYYDAIQLAERVSERENFFAEGGVRNVGRRDGIGTTLLNAVEKIGKLPDYYFQAIGSGTGAIAVHEAAQKLVADGRFGQQLPRLMLSQNTPFDPIYRSWKSRQRKFIEIDKMIGKEQIQQIVADVLSNQKPPYSIRGGVFDVLQESHGDMLTADNLETRRAMELFQETEGVDIDPAAGVALATLITASLSGQIDREATILLHITGGGWQKRKLENSLFVAEPDLQIDASDILTEEAVEKVITLF